MQGDAETHVGEAATGLELLRSANESFGRFFQHFAGIPVRGTAEEVEAMLEVERVLRSVGTLLNRGLRASQDTAMRDEIGRYRENLLRLHRELSAMENSAIRSRARLFTREEHLQAAQAWCAAARSTR